LKNTGTRAGAEVAQVYVAPVASVVPRPPKELKGFVRISLSPGEEKTATINLDRRSFAFFDPAKNDWVVTPGDYQIQIGASSRDVRLSQTITMK
jgi:beta-glucosidase